MCYPLEKSSGFEGRVNEVGDGLVAKLCSRSKVIARNGAVAMDELSGRAMFVGPLSLCLLIRDGHRKAKMQNSIYYSLVIYIAFHTL